MFQSLHLNNDIKQQTITDNFIVKHFDVYIISKYMFTSPWLPYMYINHLYRV